MSQGAGSRRHRAGWGLNVAALGVVAVAVFPVYWMVTTSFLRGVDIGTKLEVYDLIREEAKNGRTFLWYTTETDELEHCDHVYVFRGGRIVANLNRGELTEEKVIQSSFSEAS